MLDTLWSSSQELIYSKPQRWRLFFITMWVFLKNVSRQWRVTHTVYGKMLGHQITHTHVQGKKPVKRYTGVTSSFLSDLTEECCTWMDGFTACIILPAAVTHVLPNRQNNTNKIGANIIIWRSFKYTISMHTAFLGRAFCVMAEIWTGHLFNYKSDSLLCEWTCSVNNIHITS